MTQIGKEPSYSYWQLFGLFKKCPYSYYLGYEMHLKSQAPKGKMERATVEGAMYHKAMELKVKSKWSWEEMYQNFYLVVAQAMQEFPEASNRRIQKAGKEVLNLLKSNEKGRFVEYIDGLKKAEVTIKGYYKGKKLKGRIDGLVS